MEVKDRLPTARSDVDHHTVILEPDLCSGLGDEGQHARGLVAAEGGHVAERVDVVLGDDEDVHGRLRVDVVDRDQPVCGVDVVAVPGQLAEEAVFTLLGQGSPPR